MKTSSGYTLISFILVVAIIGAIAVAVLPSVSDVSSASRERQMKSELRTLRNALEFYFINWGEYPDIKQNEWEDPFVNPLLTEELRLVNQLPLDVYNPAHGYQYMVKLKGEKLAGKDNYRAKSIYVIYTKGPQLTGSAQIPKSEDFVRIIQEATLGYVTNARDVSLEP